MPYHHGDLRRALLAAAVDEVAADGVAGASLRKIAGRAGVSHTAAAHHFGDKAGLMTAVAAEGYRMLGTALAAAGGDFLEQGIAYVRFAADEPARFAVMFSPDIVHAEDVELTRAREEATRMLHGAAGARARALGGWGLVHGLATLYLAGHLPATSTDELVALTRRAAKAMAGSASR